MVGKKNLKRIPRIMVKGNNFISQMENSSQFKAWVAAFSRLQYSGKKYRYEIAGKPGPGDTATFPFKSCL